MKYYSQINNCTCAQSCLCMIASFYDIFFDQELVFSSSVSLEKGTSIYGFINLAKEIGLKCTAYKYKEKKLENSLRTPFVAIIKNEKINHFVVINSFNLELIEIWDPDISKKIYFTDIGNFYESWANIIITFQKKSK